MLSKFINPGMSVLNLYSYTGAFSLWAMKLGATNVVSVDLSPKYIEWLQQNIALNPDLNHIHHESMIKSVDEALNDLKTNNKTFDFIICDPPSSSSDGEKRTSAVKAYRDLLEKMDLLLKVSGKLVIFLNTHQVAQDKFDRILKDYLSELKLNYKMITRLHLSQDCPTLKGFPEGSYLKGIVLEKQ